MKVSLGSDRSDWVITFGRSHLPLPCDRGSGLRLADLCSARIRWGRRAIKQGAVNNNDDENDDSDDDDVADDNGGGTHVADADAGPGEGSMPDGVTVAPNMSTSRVAVNGIVDAVGGAKKKAERNCATG